MHSIPFNKPYFTGKETAYIQQAVENGKISGDGYFTQKCQTFFEEKYGFKKCFLTTSCTDALEMSAILLNIQSGDEVIVPSYSFVSCANAFVLRGAKIVFADSQQTHPNLDHNELEKLISPNTKAIVIVHYAGMACDMESILSLSEKYDFYIIEDAAHSIDSFYKTSTENKPLGSWGHLATFSFHETKNITCGEGGMLVVNDEQLIERAEIIREKGTNRSAFFRGELNKYSWVDIGSSFLTSEINAAILWAQIENLDQIQEKRKGIWEYYQKQLKPLSDQSFLQLPKIPPFAHHNYHLFYLICNYPQQRTDLISHLRSKGIHAVFHYLALHQSPYYLKSNKKEELVNATFFEEHLVRLPLYFELEQEELEFIVASMFDFFKE